MMTTKNTSQLVVGDVMVNPLDDHLYTIKTLGRTGYGYNIGLDNGTRSCHLYTTLGSTHTVRK